MSGNKVILVGVGADSTNVRPVPDLKNGSRYHYIPIPESWLTTDQYTYGSLPLKREISQEESNETSNERAVDFVDRISPFGNDGEWITDKEVIKAHPVHHDPNFEALTYGDKRGRGGVGGNLADLKSGDCLGFYTGVKDGDGKHRYIWGYFTVKEMADLKGLNTAEYRDRLRDFPDNAHAKRLKGAGKAKHEGGDDPSLVIVDGTTPAEILKKPVKISTSDVSNDDNAYWLTEDFIAEFGYDLDHHTLHPETNLSGLDRKHALYLDLSVDQFTNRIKKWQSEQY